MTILEPFSCWFSLFCHVNFFFLTIFEQNVKKSNVMVSHLTSLSLALSDVSNKSALLVNEDAITAGSEVKLPLRLCKLNIYGLSSQDICQLSRFGFNLTILRESVLTVTPAHNPLPPPYSLFYQLWHWYVMACLLCRWYAPPSGHVSRCSSALLLVCFFLFILKKMYRLNMIFLKGWVFMSR